MKTVLLIENDSTMLRVLKDNFQLKGYYVRTSDDGEQGLNIALNEEPDLIILDIMLPKINGYNICSHIRNINLDIPIILVSAKSEEADIVRGLNIGADDYLTKPFRMRELLARTEAIMRRRSSEEPATYKFGSCQLDTREGTLTCDSQEVKVSPKEFDMLHLFLRKSGCVLTRDEILDTVWGYCHFITLHDIDRFIATLRKKIEPDPNNPMFIHTIKGLGYKFEQPEPNLTCLDN